MGDLSSTKRKLRILVVAANSEDTTAELLDQEVRVCEDALGKAEVFAPAFRTLATLDRDELFGSIREWKPDILHFTGHGSPTGNVVSVDSRGWLRQMSGLTFTDNLSRFNQHLQCVFL